ncbi:MAG TPA: glutaredoxin family protein [Burkholderiaceae bacterium]|nr:glutaredoxin family protein [Burkholderiaceae bacterium]
MRCTLPSWPLSLMFLFCAASAQAELYKWVAPDGKVTYSDMPPPLSAARVEQKPMTNGSAADIPLPYELAEAAKNNPVVLYTTTKCAPCDEGRTLLNVRGIPFTEKTIASPEDMAQLHQAGGDSQLPFLAVGRNTQQGFQSNAWNALLTAAAYPDSSKLPGNYRNPPPEPAAPLPKTIGVTQEKPAHEARKDARTRRIDTPSAAGNAASGFRF